MVRTSFIHNPDSDGFAEEISILQINQTRGDSPGQIKKSSLIYKKNIGRLQQAKHSVILRKDNSIPNMLILQNHGKFGHANQETVRIEVLNCISSST